MESNKLMQSRASARSRRPVAHQLCQGLKSSSCASHLLSQRLQAPLPERLSLGRRLHQFHEYQRQFGCSHDSHSLILLEERDNITEILKGSAYYGCHSEQSGLKNIVAAIRNQAASDKGQIRQRVC